MFEIDVLLLQAEQFASSQTRGQFYVVHHENAALLGFPEEGGHRLDGQRFHLLVFQLG